MAQVQAVVLRLEFLVQDAQVVGLAVLDLLDLVVTRLGAMGTRIGLLYGLNTAGAVLGTFLAGFFLVRILGVFGSTYLAAAVNIAVALAAAVIDLLTRARPVAEEEAPATPAPEEVEAIGTLPRVALLAAFASGLLSLASEVLCLPVHPFLSDEDAARIAASLN